MQDLVQSGIPKITKISGDANPLNIWTNFPQVDLLRRHLQRIGIVASTACQILSSTSQGFKRRTHFKYGWVRLDHWQVNVKVWSRLHRRQGVMDSTQSFMRKWQQWNVYLFRSATNRLTIYNSWDLHILFYLQRSMNASWIRTNSISRPGTTPHWLFTRNHWIIGLQSTSRRFVPRCGLSSLACTSGIAF